MSTASRSDIHDVTDGDDTLTASTVTGTGQTDSPLAEVEEETDLLLKTVTKTLWALLCGNLSFIFTNIGVNWEVQLLF